MVFFNDYTQAASSEHYTAQYDEIVVDHQNAVSALNTNNLSAAQAFITGRDYKHRNREISGAASWGDLQYRAAQIIEARHKNGANIQTDAL